MEKNYKKNNGFTLTEIIVTFAIIGIISFLIVPGMLTENPAKNGWDAAAKKMTEDISRASNDILVYNAVVNDFSKLKLGSKSFSVMGANATDNMSRLYQRYLTNVNYGVNLNNDYYSQPILDYKKNSTGLVLRDAFTNYVLALDGVIVGFKFYGTCKATEKYTNPPETRAYYSEDNVCGSIFFDVNGYEEPNKLGSDQYIIPIGIRGVQYKNNKG